MTKSRICEACLPLPTASAIKLHTAFFSPLCQLALKPECTAADELNPQPTLEVSSGSCGTSHACSTKRLLGLSQGFSGPRNYGLGISSCVLAHTVLSIKNFQNWTLISCTAFCSLVVLQKATNTVSGPQATRHLVTVKCSLVCCYVQQTCTPLP